MKIVLTESQFHRIIEQVNNDTTDVKSYPACVASETSNKRRGELKRTQSNQYYIEIYIGGLTGYKFYNNGRVMYPNGKLGNYSCNGRDIMIDGIDISSQNWQKQKGKYTTNYEKGVQKSIETQQQKLQAAGEFYEKYAHLINPWLQVGASFVPVIGPFLALGIGLGDAATYFKEGKQKEAGLVAVLSLLPGVSSVVQKIPAISTLGQKGMSALASKIVGKQTLSAAEQKVASEIMNQRELIQNALSSRVQQLATNVSEKVAKLPSAQQNVVKGVGKRGLDWAKEQAREQTVTTTYNASAS